MTPEARENQLVSLAMDLVEQRLLDGTASSQETTSILKMGTAKARLELEKLQVENELNRAKTAVELANQARKEEIARREQAMKELTKKQGESNDKNKR